MNSIDIVLVGRPASKKNSRQMVFRQGRHFSFPSKAYARFHTDAMVQLLQQKGAWKIKQFDQPVGINYLFKQKGNYKQDLDNAITSINDVLQDFGIITDDTLVHMITARKEAHATEWETCVKITLL